jgi:phenylacetate-CoA ligase
LNKTLIQLYNQMPGSVQNIFATVRGYQLRGWRYGANAEALVEEALARDSWSPQQWKNYQDERLSRILHTAATKVPYYRDQWAERRRNGDNASWDYLENWRVLEKAPVRTHPQAFIPESSDLNALYHINTSGTTGTPLHLWSSRTTVQAWYALYEARWRRWNGVSRHERWVIMGGQLVIPAARTRPPFWVRNYAMNQLYLSTMHLNPQNTSGYVEAINRYQPTHMVVYTSSATYLAQEILRQNLQITAPIRVILTNAEPLFPWQREALESAFKAKVKETYGMGEMVIGASADANDNLRYWQDAGILEILDDEADNPVPDGTTGRVVSTGLLREDGMMFIRYALGDRASISTRKPTPTDPIQLPYLGAVEGRSTDLLVGKNGQRVFWINPIFYELPLKAAQVIQEDRDHINVMMIPSDETTDATMQTIRERLQQRVGDLQIDVQCVEALHREASGKIKPVISRIKA